MDAQNYVTPATHAAAVGREEELHWLALRLVPGLGTLRAVRLLTRLGSVEAIFRASVSELESLGLPGSVARTVASGCTFEEAVSQHEKLLAAGAVLISLRDPRYPRRLREIPDPPVVLFACGRVELLASPVLGVIGTRRPTPYGVAATSRLSADLAKAGLTIASGMARGIDTSAHKAALEAGCTIAVFGCGVDRVYPAENRRLAHQIAEQGLLVSEFPMGTPAHPQNFPIRNRIISGISVGVLVVEGAQYSGSAITAKLAMEQGREVFAVPGNITSKWSWGPNLLIKQGAKLVQECNDVLEELAPEIRRELADRRRAAGVQETAEPTQASLPLERAPGINDTLMRLLPADRGMQVDDILENVENYSSSEVIAALFELEMGGLVRQLPGKNFVKVW